MSSTQINYLTPMRPLLSSLILICSLSFATAAAQDNNCPCSSSEHRAFDFWIGQWEVYLPNGSLGGKNTIRKIEGGCALREEWVSTASKGYTGTSYNFYNAIDKQWEQLWIDNQGAFLKLRGGIDNDGSMVLKGDPVKGLAGRMQINRITWTPNSDGSVRQLWEVSFDQENTWTVAFDGKYVKVGD